MLVLSKLQEIVQHLTTKRDCMSIIELDATAFNDFLNSCSLSEQQSLEYLTTFLTKGSLSLLGITFKYVPNDNIKLISARGTEVFYEEK